MRISDWSSDVCSSDLDSAWPYPCGLCAEPLFYRGNDGLGRSAARRNRVWARGFHRRSRSCPHRWPRCRGYQGRRRLDRKSVVKGKSVSVRVDPGGRWLIKKKITTRQNQKKKNN